MDPRHLVYAERQAPRYTSYPTAPHFTPSVNARVVTDWLADLGGDDVSLYVHVPYCRQLCWYCGCNTYAARRDEPLFEYVETLLQEVDHVSALSSARNVVELHWGGGTPNILEATEFTRIVDWIGARFDVSGLAHHAIELDPRYVTPAKAAAYVGARVNRVSLGVQDLNERVQRAIGRVQPLSIVEEAIATLRSAGVAGINMDLMYGLPHQGLAELRNTVELAAGLRPDRIALFGYAHVPWFKKRQRLIPEAALPGAAERFEQAETARSVLEVLGYVAVGLDHFALPDDELALAARNGNLRRSFQGYVVQQAPALIGLGPSAISTLPQGYTQNLSEPGAWAQTIMRGEIAVARGHKLSDTDRARRRFIEQIMCDFEADLSPIGGVDACAGEIASLAPMIADGLVQIAEDRLVLSEAAYPLCRVVGAAFDTYAGAAQARHSKAV